MIYSHKYKIGCKKYGFAAIISFYTLSYIVIPMMDDSLYINIADVGQGLFTTIKYKGADMAVSYTHLGSSPGRVIKECSW